MNFPLFLNMELGDYARGWSRFANGLENELIKQMHEKKELFEEFITEQLYSGLNGDEVPLRPTYTNDPYFNMYREPKKAAERYKKWKARIQPPARSYLGFKPRDIDTPNLIIRGDFYSSITAVPIADGVMIARGAQGNPWIFRDAIALWKGEELPSPPTKEEKIATVVRHLEHLAEVKSEYIAVKEMRKHVGWYLKGMHGAVAVRRKVNTINDMTELKQELLQLL